MKKILLVIICSIILFSFRATETKIVFTKELFYQELINQKIDEPQIVFAQAALETGWFKSKRFKMSNNLFAMKMPKRRLTTAIGTYNGYATYETWIDSIEDYGIWQQHHKRKYTKEGYLCFINRIYAEDPQYIAKVRKIIAHNF